MTDVAEETAAAAAASGRRTRVWVLVTTILASAMGFIDGSILGVALPSIAADLGARFEDLQWTVGGYLLSLSAFLAVGGALGDRFGRVRVFVIGIAVFSVASAVCALASSAGMLVAARVVQGVGAALMIPQSLAIIAATFPKAERGAAIGLWASASALTTALGPILGGFLIETVGWEAVFWINPPMGLLAIAIALWRAPESRAPAAECGRPDWLGAGLISGGLGLVSYALIALPELGARPALLGAAALGIVLLAFFPAVERRAAATGGAPIAPPALFAAPGFLRANAVTVLLYGGLAAVLFLLPLDLIGRHGHGEQAVGLMLLPFAATIGLLSRWAGRLADRLGPRLPIATGSLCFMFASIALAATPVGLPYWFWLFPAITGLGLGMTLAVAPLTTAVLNAAPDALSGAASGVNNTAARASGLVAVAAVGALAAFVYARSAGLAAAPRLETALTAGDAATAGPLGAAMTAGYLACAALGAVSAWAALGLPGAPSAVEPVGERIPER